MPTIEEFTQEQVQEQGTFRAFPVSWTVEKSTQSESHAIAFRFAIHQKWHPPEGDQPGTWSQEYPIGWFSENRTWVVGKDGQPNPKAIENLRKCGLWDGDWGKLAGPPPNVFVHVQIEQEQFEGKTRYRVNWINPDADEPVARGGFAPVDATLLESLRARFQSATRAIAGGVPSGKPPPPPQPALATPAVASPATPVHPSRPAPAAATTRPATPGTTSAPRRASAPTPSVAAPATPAQPQSPAAEVGLVDETDEKPPF